MDEEEEEEAALFPFTCFDPTYCITEPPVPKIKNAESDMIGDYSNYDFKYNGSEVITYTCENPSNHLHISSSNTVSEYNI